MKPEVRCCIFCLLDDHRRVPATRSISNDDMCDMHVRVNGFKATAGKAIRPNGNGNGNGTRPAPAECKDVKRDLTSEQAHLDVTAGLVGLGWKAERARVALDRVDPERKSNDVDHLLRSALAVISAEPAAKERSMREKTGRRPGRPRKSSSEVSEVSEVVPAIAARPSTEPVTQAAGRGILIVSEAMVDSMFLRWPLDDKIRCVQSWLDLVAMNEKPQNLG